MNKEPHYSQDSLKRFERRYKKFVKYSKYTVIIAFIVLLGLFFTFT